MTLPTLTRKYQNKILESQFKKSVSVISQGILTAKEKSGLDKFTTYCVNYDEHTYINKDECSAYLNQAFFGKTNPPSMPIKHGVKNFNGKYEITSYEGVLASYGYSIFLTNALPDGSFLNFHINEHQLQIGVDTNGDKGPNRLGYDIFLFSLNHKDYISPIGTPKNYTDQEIDNMDLLYPTDWYYERVGVPCNLHSSQKANGIGCSYYALLNECPFDSSKKYFECLP